MIFTIRRDLLVIPIINMNIVLYEGACNPATAAEIVRPTSDVGPTERVDH